MYLTAWGATYLGHPRWSDSASLKVIGEILPFEIWGILLILLGIGFLGQFFKVKHETRKTPILMALVGLVASVTSIWAVGTGLEFITGPALTSPVGPILYSFLTALHLIMSKLPIQDEEQHDEETVEWIKEQRGN